MEHETTYNLRTKASADIIRVLACSPWHAKQKAAQLHSEIESNPNNYHVLPKLNKARK
jgi:hypothetical protein